MSRTTRMLAWTLVALAAIASASCVEGGIGMGVPSSGARFSGPGPDVLVLGGPVYR